VRVGRIRYINCFPVYGAIDRGIVPLGAPVVSGNPSELNQLMASGQLDVSVISAVEYARDSARYLLLPDLGITSDGPVRSVMLFSRMPAQELTGRRVLVSRSSMTSVALTRLLFEHVWRAKPDYAAGDAELTDIARFLDEPHDARLVIGDAALLLANRVRASGAEHPGASD
jgi:chorismate dehydratase